MDELTGIQGVETVILEQLESIELTPMQAAYWVGRESKQALCGMAAHLYTEFDTQHLDPQRLAVAVKQLFTLHPMLRVQVNQEGRQTIAPLTSQHDLTIHDLTLLSDEEVQQKLRSLREQMSHQKLDLSQGKAADFRLTLFGNGRCRLHVDLDMIAADAQSFRIVLEDLARLYEGDVPEQDNEAPCPFFRFLTQQTSGSNGFKVSRDWWQKRLSQVAPAPDLPYLTNNASAAQCQTERFAKLMSCEQHQQLQQVAKQQRLTLTTVCLALFAQSLAKATCQRRFRLNVPAFFRPGNGVDVQRVVGDFSRLMLLSVEVKDGQSLSEFASDLATQMQTLLSYSDYPGVNVMRDLSRHTGELQSSPVVFTSGVNLPQGSLLSQQVDKVFGEMVWAISQGAQVTLDAQITELNQGLLINWDVRMDVFPAGFIEGVFDDYTERLTRLAANPDVMTHSASERMQFNEPVTMPLNELQKAYLIGRDPQMPLGGVAMHDFREFHGHVEEAQLRQTLSELVAHYPLLRTRIDVEKMQSVIYPQGVMNIEQVDVSHLSPQHAAQRAERVRQRYQQRLYDLELQSPWQICIMKMPAQDGQAAPSIIFTSFDALIADGQAISHILTLLFERQQPRLEQKVVINANQDDAPRIEADKTYWQQKLSDVTDAPHLPWKMPLVSIRNATYQRQSIAIDKAQLMSLTRVGAGERLFQNSLLSALLLETLAQWRTDETPLCVGVPVAIPDPNKALTNDSTFVTVVYQPNHGSFIDRAKQLQQDVMNGLEHLQFSGVDLARLLLSKNAEQSVALPVVLTNALSWSLPSLQSGVELVSAMTQTPQVAMDLRLSFDQQRNLIISVDYATQAIEDGLVTAFLGSLQHVMSQVRERQTLELKPGDFISRQHLTRNSANEQFQCSQFLQRIYDNLYGQHSQAIALWHNESAISYQHLGEQVDRVRRHFVDLQLKQGDVVAICLPRSPEHVVMTLACALSGLIWVPIDARSPSERLDYLLTHCDPQLILANQAISASHASVKLVDDLLLSLPRAQTLPERDYAAASSALTAGYYLYTSGTTGQPKCVVVNNQATSNVIGATIAQWQMTRRDVGISVTPLHHDMSVFDLLGTMTVGASLVLPDAEQDKNALLWNQLVKRHQVTIWCSVPAILEMLLACEMSDDLASLRLVAQGGDYIKPKTIAYLRQHLPALSLYSLGGPTETTIWSIWHPLEAQDIEVIPYGHPLPATQYYIVDETLSHCPPYKVGRIVTAGVGLSLGYLQHGELQQTDFIELDTPEGESVRAFRTGDMGYFRADGTIIFATRVNGYVKVRGVRLSMPDVEKVLRQIDAIQDTIVFDYQEPLTGDTALCALYTLTAGQSLSQNQLREQLKSQLPVSHLPSQMVQIPAFPLSANGKIDRNRAKTEWLQTSQGAKETVSTSTFTGDFSPILAIYAKVLGVEQALLNQQSRFMDLGLIPSHLKPLATELNRHFGAELKPVQLARCHNVEQVADLLSQ
ncbi:amino acid adenylation domain-containing protein [Vibrio sp. AK197]